MKMRAWWSAGLMACLAGCGQMGQTSDETTAGHGEVLAKESPGFVWGPAAPEPPIMPSPVPQLPEQPNSPMNPGDGRQETDKTIPSTSNPAMPK